MVINTSYLLTLDSDSTYTFRIRTNEGYVDKVIECNFNGASIELSQNKYENEDVIIVELSSAINVEAIYIDGLLINEYTQEGNVIKLDASVSKYLTSGTHKIIIHTENGRPSAEFRIMETYNYVEEVVESNHVWFFIDIAIFAVIILGYGTYMIFNKRKEVE